MIHMAETYLYEGLRTDFAENRCFTRLEVAQGDLDIDVVD